MPEERKEVVFLPYKAPMWDFLESVWKAADEEENTDAYVIPIPYFDKNPDGSFREEHYEGDLYPDNVPITRYEEYDFKNRRPDNEEVESIKHFFITPGVFHADQVIVQSESMKKAYVEALTDFMKENSGKDTREYWEKKIRGTGSPKMDKVMDARKENMTVPEEWLKIIEKPDGSRKKIIFYNTSVQALLNHNEKMNQKIQDVLQVFKENQEEVAEAPSFY